MSLSALQPIICRCDKCQAMCEHSSCVPTPAEARALIRAGYAARMQRYKFDPRSDESSVVAPAIVGFHTDVLPRTNFGRCTFLTHDGLCELHHSGLKPLEGRIAHHDRDWLLVRRYVLGHWRGKQYESVSKQLLATLARKGGE